MSAYLVIAIGVTMAIVLVHTIVGEIMFIKPLLRAELTPLVKGTIRATWHIASAFGVFVVIVLCRDPDRTTLDALAAVYAGSAAILMAATRLRHPAWIGFVFGAAMLALAAR